MESQQQAVPLIGNYVVEDFYTDKPYKEIYDQRNNRFIQQTMITKMRDLAVSLGFKGFMANWKAYVSAQRSDAPMDDSGNETLFEGQETPLLCGSYVCTDRVTRTNEFGMEVEVIPHPIMPVMRLINIETLEAKLSIAFQRGKDPWKTITVPREPAP